MSYKSYKLYFGIPPPSHTGKWSFIDPDPQNKKKCNVILIGHCNLWRFAPLNVSLVFFFPRHGRVQRRRKCCGSGPGGATWSKSQVGNRKYFLSKSPAPSLLECYLFLIPTCIFASGPMPIVHSKNSRRHVLTEPSIAIQPNALDSCWSLSRGMSAWCRRYFDAQMFVRFGKICVKVVV